MRQQKNSELAALMEQVITNRSAEISAVFGEMHNLAMRMERYQFLGAGAYERSDNRRGYANGLRSKKIDTVAGTMSVKIPKTRGTEESFYPQTLERGRRSTRAVMLSVAEMYIKGVSTRGGGKVMAKFGIESLSSTQVSRATKLRDGELDAWRNRPLNPVRHEKVRLGGII